MESQNSRVTTPVERYGTPMNNPNRPQLVGDVDPQSESTAPSSEDPREWSTKYYAGLPFPMPKNPDPNHRERTDFIRRVKENYRPPAGSIRDIGTIDQLALNIWEERERQRIQYRALFGAPIGIAVKSEHVDPEERQAALQRAVVPPPDQQGCSGEQPEGSQHNAFQALTDRSRTTTTSWGPRTGYPSTKSTNDEPNSDSATGETS